MHRRSHFPLVVLLAAGLLPLSGTASHPDPAPHADPAPHPDPAPRAAAALPARWLYHADVNGDGAPDRVILRPGADLAVREGRWGSGHYTLRVRFAGGGTVARRMSVSDYYSPQPWTPWYGATQIDHVRGKDLVVGLTSGAHADVYAVVTYRGGRLRLLDSPLAETGWLINSSLGTGSQGWKCTTTGVMSRSVVPVSGATRYRIERSRYVLRLAWHRTTYTRYTVAAGPGGRPPSYTSNYATFYCPGLPDWPGN